MSRSSGLHVEYVPPKIPYNEQEEERRLLRFITLFAQVGFREISLNPKSSLHLFGN